ncbi:MAG TPA: LPS export ABC transporter ATP-binding protein [Longimicrobium sp.]|nr:LPS export ABC transporter ATP-binding protein [Longimicrobium sp.]
MSAAGFEGLVRATGPGDLSKLIALRALVDRANGDGSVERANWLTGVREEYQRWYARHNAHGHPENFPADETLRYLDEHIVRTLAADGVLQPVLVPGAVDGPGPDGDLPWHAVRLSTWAAGEVDGERDRVLDLLDTRIRTILEHTNDPAPSAATPVAATAATGLIDLPPAPQMDGPAMHEDAAEAPIRPGEMLVPGGATLAAKGLVKVYRKRRVVNEVDVHVSQGEIVGLLGPNGAGKTTSFYMMVGLIRPDKGKVFIGSRDLTGVPMFKRARAGIGYLAQEPSIFRKLTVEENVMAILQMMKIKRSDRKARLEQLLDELSIKHLRKTRAYALSGGERRRLEITRALVGNPKFMLLDEPFAGVDPIAVHDIQQIVSDLRRRGIGVLISDHNVEQTLDIVDRAYIMYDGRVRVSGTVAELVWNEEVAEIYLGPTLTARMRERYPNPALEAPEVYGEPRGGDWDAAAADADDVQWADGAAWGVEGGALDGGSSGDAGFDGGAADGRTADDGRREVSLDIPVDGSAADGGSAAGAPEDAGPMGQTLERGSMAGGSMIGGSMAGASIAGGPAAGGLDHDAPPGGGMIERGSLDGESADGFAGDRTFGGGVADGVPVERGAADRGTLAGRRPDGGSAEGGSAEIVSADGPAGGRSFGGVPAERGAADRGTLAGRRPDDGAMDADRTLGGGWTGGAVDHEERGRPLAAADGSEPVWADEDDDDGEHGGADGRTGDASQG